MMGNWWRVFGRERTADLPTARPAAPSAGLAADAVPVQPAIPCDEIAERFFRFILSQPVSAGDNPNKVREQAILQRLRDQCESGRFDVRSLPRMPTVLPQLMRAMKNDQLSGSQLADLIKRDPVLVGEVMRVTGSVTYRTAHPIGSLQHAVVLLGQIGLRHVVTSYVMKPILMASAGTNGQLVGQRLWDHAERCGHAAVYLSKGQCDAFEAYLVALMGYSGLGAVGRMLDRELQLTELPASSPAFIDECVRLAAQLTVQAGQHWELPPPVLEALVEHADHGSAALALPMSRVLHVAQRLAMYQLLSEQGLLDRDSGYGNDPIATFPPQLLARCQQDLRKSFDAA
ncbi:HDOD domain-containing protein [Dyella telluris]|uniref:HDOD domain-containing protein n=1 Tax=Dyella telluris TaxID=2763498 RepID=A0A7G8Q5N9_9GAMM|nr:HDOD domain-containing protein [Dyella telluris]QNK02097.1 HDOD domain-containing protein [Dyella telluris]